jgi:spore coat polysaccharide biosynthesis protein SpsF
MDSARLPGKVMRKICGEPLIYHIIERLKLCKCINKIILATSNNPKDDILERTVRKHGIDVFRGPEADVLERFYQVVCKYRPKHVVRICADSPLIDPVEIDRIIQHHINRRADYSFNHIPKMDNHYPDGVGAEVFKGSILEDLMKRKTTKAEKEHINGYIWNHSNQFHIETIKAPSDIAYPQYRFEVNTEDDLKFIEKIYKKLYRGEYFSTRDVIEYLQVKKAELV